MKLSRGSVVLGAGVLLIAGGLAVWVLWKPVGTIETQVEALKFTPITPPSRLNSPGTIARVLSRNPLALQLICSAAGALGDDVAEACLASPSASIDVATKLSGRFKFEAATVQQLQAQGALRNVRQVTFSLTNVRIVELADEEVFRRAKRRNTFCGCALAARRQHGEPVTMVQSAILADVTYTAEFLAGTTIEGQTAALQELGLALRAEAAQDGSRQIVGHDLIWGVREDASLLDVLDGLAPTGSVEKQPLLHVTDRIRSIEKAMLAHCDVWPIQQPSPMGCWATVATMLESWRENKRISIAEYLSELGTPWRQDFEADRGLSPEDVAAFANATGLQMYPPQNFTIEAYVAMLRDHGPMWITTTGSGISSHARLLIGVYGDGTPDCTDFEFVDPATGTTRRQAFRHFLESYEKEARLLVESDRDEPLRIQVLQVRS